jgi:hypothetical protein
MSSMDPIETQEPIDGFGRRLDCLPGVGTEARTRTDHVKNDRVPAPGRMSPDTDVSLDESRHDHDRPTACPT